MRGGLGVIRGFWSGTVTEKREELLGRSRAGDGDWDERKKMGYQARSG